MCQTYGLDSSTCNCSIPPARKIGDWLEYPISIIDVTDPIIHQRRWIYPSDYELLGLESADKGKENKICSKKRG